MLPTKANFINETIVEKNIIFCELKAKTYFKEIYQMNPRQDSIIDAIRALSVLSIIAFHVVVGIIQVYDFEKAKAYILLMPKVLQPLWHGEKGVDAFFLISALVLGMPLFKKIESFNWDAAKNFYIKRFLRIYPLFFVALCLYTIGQWSYFGKYFISNLFLINNLIDGERTIIPVGWSLLVEVQYYFFIPLFFLIFKSIKMPKTILVGTVISSFFACAWRLHNNSDLYVRPIIDLFLASDRSLFTKRMGELYYESNLTRYGAFVIGLLLAYLRTQKNNELVKALSSKGAGFLLFAGFVLFVAFGCGLPMYDPNSIYYRYFTPTLNFLVLISQRQIFSLGLFCLILGCWYSPLYVFNLFRKLFSQRFWIPFSRLSFPIYLFHFPFIALAAVAVLGTVDVKTIESVSFMQGCGIFILATFLTVLFSVPLYIYVERPFIEIGKMRQNKTKV